MQMHSDASSARSTRRLSRPPTQAGGPLSSHPTHDNDDWIPPMPGSFPTSTDANKENTAATMSSDSERITQSSLNSPTSPVSQSTKDTQYTNPTERQSRPSSVRRLFSLSNLRQSFSSSRTSFSIPPASSHGTRQSIQQDPRPTTSMSLMSTPASTMHSRIPPNSLRKKRSSNWFKRKSGFFTVDEDGFLDLTNDDPRDPKRFKPANPLPVLPEIDTIAELNEGSIGWDDQLFKR